MASSPRIEELRKKFDENPRRYFAPLANEYRKAGELEQAIAICRMYLPQQPGHMSGHIVFGQALFEAQQYDEARGVFETALGLDPENLIALRHLGDIARFAGDPVMARRWYERVLEADPRNEEIAAQIEALSAVPEPAPAAQEAPRDDGGLSGWGEINPERADAASAAPIDAFGGALGGEPTGEVAGAALAAQPPAPTAGHDLGLERSGDVHVPTTAQRGGGDFERSGASDLDAFTLAEPTPRAAAPQPVPQPPRPVPQPASPANDLGLEVMEFVPPSREQQPPPQPHMQAHDRAAFGGHASGAADEATQTPSVFVTETMAELYLQQGFHQEALGVYRQLLSQNPTDMALAERIRRLEEGLSSSVGVAAISEQVIESAQKRQTASSVRTAGAFFGALAGRRAPVRGDVYEPAAASELPASGDGAGTATMEPPPVPTAEPDWIQPDAPIAETTGASHTAPPVPHVQEQAAHEPDADVPEGGAPLDFILPDADEAPTPAPAHDPPVAPAASTPRPQTPGSLDALFSGAGVSSDDDSAASLLAKAFAPEEPAPTAAPPAAPPASPVAAQPEPAGEQITGRPAAPATNELSLDSVFRQPGRSSAKRSTGDFSFDQFFSDSAESTRGGGEDESRPGAADAPSPDDIQQFNVWLEGLKKK